MEATPDLRPAKHKWYSACFIVLLLTVVMETLGKMHTTREIYSLQERIEFFFELLGGTMVLVIYLAPALAFLIALLFLFEGWLSRAIVGTALTAWMFTVLLLFIGTLGSPKSVNVKPAWVQTITDKADKPENADRGVAEPSVHKLGKSSANARQSHRLP